jgi:hypothetical protein
MVLDYLVLREIILSSKGGPNLDPRQMDDKDRERRHMWAREGGSGALRGIRAGYLRLPLSVEK